MLNVGVYLQKLAEDMSSVLSCLLSSLIGYRMLREAAAMPAIPWTKSKGVPLEAWIHIDGRNVPQSIREGMKPEWHVACKEEVRLLLTGIVNFKSVRYWALTTLRLSSPAVLMRLMLGMTFARSTCAQSN